ncbi:MAG: mechanosensitive ion channel [Ruminococcaceae bacterium]|nr:mechanosensitive ion channel [Oscillospiraceae bacterium]
MPEILNSFFNLSLGIAQSFVGFCVDVAWRLIAALAVFIVGHIVIKVVLKKMKNAKKLKGADPTATTFLQSAVKFGSYAVVLIAVIAILGVPMASVITVLASVGAAVALAVKGAFSNLVGGIMLLFFKPISVGDFVEISGKSGTVDEVGIFYTQLATGDNLTVSVPNAILTDSVIVNYSRKDLRRLDLALDVAYGTDIEKAKQVIESTIAAQSAALTDPAPFVRMTAMKESSIEITVRVWCKKGDYGVLKSDLYEALDKSLAEAKVEIPFPHLDVHMSK